MLKLKFPLLLFLAFSFNLKAQTLTISPQGINEKGIDLENNFQVFEDETKSILIGNFIKSNNYNFVSLNNFAAKESKSHYWLKMEISNQMKTDFEALLKFDYLSHVSVYVIQNQEVTETAYGGEYSKEKNRRPKDGRLYLRFDIPKKSTVEIFIKVRQRKGYLPHFDNFKLYEEETYHLLTKNKPFVEALVFGSFAMFLVYGLLIYFKSKHKPYLWLSLTLLFKGVFFVQMLGYFPDLVIPNYPKIGWDMLVLLMYAGAISGLLLLRDFLNLKKEYPLYYKLFNAFSLFLIFQALLQFYIKHTYENYLLSNSIGFASYIPQGILIVVVLVKLITKVPPIKKPIIIASCISATITLYTSINFLFNLEASYGQYTWNEIIVMLVFMFFFFYSLGEEMALNEVEKNKALAKINVIVEGQKAELNKQVIERTVELEQSKEEIETQNDKLSDRNGQIETLLKEVHHRVKNNLQVISSLLDLQSRNINNEETSSAFKEGQNRVKAMALIHQKLYQNDDFSSLDFSDYAKQLLLELSFVYPNAKNVNCIVRSETQLAFDIDTAIPLGLILNELISNAFKYAFADAEKGELIIEFKILEDRTYQMIVQDNGTGLPENFNFAKAKSLGLRLVRRLTKQLYGKVLYQQKDGANFSINFKDTAQRKEN